MMFIQVLVIFVIPSPNGEEKDVFIGPENASLNGIASVINSDPANGLNAVVINDGSGDEAPWRLNLSLTESGDENKVEWHTFISLMEMMICSSKMNKKRKMLG